MFKIVKPSVITWPVKGERPVSGGRTEEFSFDGKFKQISQTEFEQILNEIRNSADTSLLSDVPMAKKYLVDWSGVQDEKGTLPFSEEALNDLLEVPGVASAVVRAFLESVQGARRKN